MYMLTHKPVKVCDYDIKSSTNTRDPTMGFTHRNDSWMGLYTKLC